MFHKKIEMSMPILFILLGIAAFAYAMTIPKEDGMFLKIIALIMIVTSAAILYFVLREQKNVVNMGGVDLKKVIVTVIVLCAYALVLEFAGYLAATFVLAVFTIRYLNYKKMGNHPWLCNICNIVDLWYILWSAECTAANPIFH